MSDRSEGPGWWLASDGKWYPPQSATQPPPIHAASADSAFDIWKSVVTEKYAQFDGRARRAEFWWFALVNMGIAWAIVIIGAILGSVNDALGTIASFAYFGYVAAMIVPAIAVSVRRLHDTGKSGGLWFLIFIPLVGAIILLVFYATDGDPTSNRYGPSPKYVTSG